jgi:large subunit ribosomal protein L13
LAENKELKVVYVDGTDMVLGRLGSYIAKSALQGNKIILLNCEKVVKTGKKQQVIDEYLEKVKNIKGRHKGPFWPRRPDTIVRRAIKRMLPYKRERGKKALKRIEVYIGVPKEYESAKLEKFEGAKLPKTIRFITIGELSERIGKTGWK